MKYYNLSDTPNRRDRERMGIDAPSNHQVWRYVKNGEQVQIRAVLTNEKRSPHAGEWYLSGAISEAYRALNDLLTKYRIVKLVTVRKVEKWEVV